MSGPWITFLSDYGHEDEFVGVCHGVLARGCPAARVIDITHGVPRHDVRHGALALLHSLPFCPAGVHLAVVDPEVGVAARRAVALRVASEERLLVGPDNGLLAPVAEALGGVLEAVEVGFSPHRLEPVSATFHGRDIFAPVAAALARGEPLGDAGEPLAVDELRALALPRARVLGTEEGIEAHVLTADRFGNLALDASHAELGEGGLHLGDAVEVELSGRRWPARFAVTFTDVGVGELLLYEDARRMAALAVNRGSAAQALGAVRDTSVLLRRHRPAGA